MANLTRFTGQGMEPRRRLLDPFEMMREMMDMSRSMMPAFLEERGMLAAGFMPRFEVVETEGGITVRGDVPGVKEDDIDISVADDMITIRGKREEEKRQENDRFHAYERSFGSFVRSFPLPRGVDPDSARAEMHDGVLTIEMKRAGNGGERKIRVGNGGSRKSEKAEKSEKK